MLAVSALLVSLASTSIAQPAPAEREPKAQAQTQTEEQELKIPELAPQEINPEVLSIAIPKPCGATHPDIQIHGNPAGNLTLSPALKSFLSSHNITPKGYDNPTINKVFADSFKLRNCRVCYATLEVRFKHGPGPWSQGAANYSNDTITVGVAGFTTRFVNGASIWSGTMPNPKTVTYALVPTTTLNNYIFNVNPPPPYLDIVVQDDTEVDYCKLTVWYY
jgi:hypothetical protein